MNNHKSNKSQCATNTSGRLQIFRKSDVVPAGVEEGLTVRKRGTRTSLTFRKVLRGPCDCSFPKYCDSRIVTNSAPEADVEAMARAEIASLEVITLKELYLYSLKETL